MADNDPFAEPDDTDKTVIRPNPGGRRPPVAPVPGAAQPAAAPQAPSDETPQPAAAKTRASHSDPKLDAGMTGMNPLNAAASTLFSRVSRIRNRAQHPDPDALRRSVIAEVRAFENRALQARIDAQDVKIARYAICATLDDVVLNTPWGGTSVWAQQSMVGTFHRETVGGDRFYDLLARLEQDPGRNIDLLEFLYMCLSLGFEGRLRVETGGADKHMNIRAGLARIIRAQRGEMEHDLSPHWQGLDRPHRPLSAWKPFWISVAVVAAVLGTGFVGLSYALSNSTERLLGQMSALDPGAPPRLERRAPPVIVEEPEPDHDAQLKRVSAFLQEEIDEGLVEVFQDANLITVRIAGSNMFASASDRLQPEFDVPLGRVASALNDTAGPVIVVGHSDSQPIRTARFPSNDHLSLARAESVVKKLSDQLDDPSRLSAEGRAAKEPIADNSTAEGRARNRRIELLLIREEVE
jgi:type VI secretion system protein ImpK